MRSLLSIAALVTALAACATVPALADIKSYGVDNPDIPNCSITVHTDCEHVVLFSDDGVTSAKSNPLNSD